MGQQRGEAAALAMAEDDAGASQFQQLPCRRRRWGTVAPDRRGAVARRARSPKPGRCGTGARLLPWTGRSARCRRPADTSPRTRGRVQAHRIRTRRSPPAAGATANLRGRRACSPIARPSCRRRAKATRGRDAAAWPAGIPARKAGRRCSRRSCRSSGPTRCPPLFSAA
ncbi:hypothetical protein G6F22_017320 [Rhizopus arrhizus]|nr:hypothetical protein G6F22_017320 [Rhizopus arrhizus]